MKKLNYKYHHQHMSIPAIEYAYIAYIFRKVRSNFHTEV